MDQTEDFEIIKLVLNGDRDSYRVLVQRYQNQVFSSVMRVIGEREISMELTQDVFVKAYQALSSFRFKAKFSTWLTRIALNHTNSFLSSRRFKDLKKNVPFNAERHDSGEIDSDNEHGDEEIVRLRTALSRLPIPFREVVTLCDLEGKSYEEAALILEIPIGTIRSRLNRARLKLKDAFMMEVI